MMTHIGPQMRLVDIEEDLQVSKQRVRQLADDPRARQSEMFLERDESGNGSEIQGWAKQPSW